MESLDVKGIFLRAFKGLKLAKCSVTSLMVCVTLQLSVGASVSCCSVDAR